MDAESNEKLDAAPDAEPEQTTENVDENETNNEGQADNADPRNNDENIEDQPREANQLNEDDQLNDVEKNPESAEDGRKDCHCDELKEIEGDKHEPRAEEERNEEQQLEEEEEKEGELTERQEDQVEEVAPNMTVMVRSGGHPVGGEERVEVTTETYEEAGNGSEAVQRQNVMSDSRGIRQYSNDAAATVRFLLMPSQQVATQRCLLIQTIAELRHQFAVEMKVDDEWIQVLHDAKVLIDGVTLGDLGIVPNGTIQLALQSTDPANHPLQLVRPRQDYHMPDVITVRIHIDNVNYRDVVVEIERATNRKPFLGGYRHKTTGVEYHHAAAQTLPKPRPPPAVEMFCRDTQTAHLRNIRQQTANETSTQMTTIGTYVSNQQDKLVEPRRYVTADEREAAVIKQVIVIQKYYRRWLGARKVAEVRENERRRLQWEKEEELKKIKEKDDRITREFERRMNPKNKEDFDLLFHALEKWRQEQLAIIDSTLTGAERKAALCMLLDQETQLIASIGRHKLDADSENRQKFIREFLEKTASPKKWKGPDGKETQLDTPYTLRARQLKEIYNSINMGFVTQDERLDILLTLKHTVKEHDCKLTQEIIELVDREADLLIRGVKECNLDGLRKRISILFLQYIKTPTFNPEAARYLKVPQDSTALRKNIYYCNSCCQYLPSTEFQLSSNSKAVGKCRQCSKMTNIAITRQEFTQYAYMLKNVCRSEEELDDGSKIAFLMQEKDIRYLVEKIWDSQSILSAWCDLYELVLVRWNRCEEWSPWNCILLTKEEAGAHEKIDCLEDAYGVEFMNRVKQKHTMAKSYFFRLPIMAEHMHANSQPHGSRAGNGSASMPTVKPSLSAKRVVQTSA